jgi:S1-C subfamily serine protease
VAVGFVSVISGALVAGSLMFTAGGLGEEPQRLGLSPLATLVPAGAGDLGIVGVAVDRSEVARSASAMVLSDGIHVVTSSQVVAGITPAGVTDTAGTGTAPADGPVVRVIDERGVARRAEVVGIDPVNDLAVLRTSGVRLTPFDTDRARTPAAAGEQVMYGGGFGAGLRRWSAAIAALGVAYHGDRVDHVGITLLADPLPAAAGGAVAIDEQGRFAGLVSVDLRRGSSGGAARLPAVVVPAARVLRTAAEFLERGEITHAWLGVEAAPVIDASSTTARAGGAPVEHVVPDSPAGTAGLHPGDLITHLCEERVTSIDDVAARVLDLAPGTRCTVDVQRGDTTWHTELVLGRRAA